MQRTRTALFLSIVCVFALCIGVASVAAQPSLPISIGQNAQGTLSQQQPTAEFVLTISTPQVITMQALSLTAGFAPAFSVLAPSGVVVATNANPDDANLIASTINLTETGAYSILIQRASAGFGQFVVTVEPGAPAAPPIPINLGQVVNDSVDGQTSLRNYGFAASPSEPIVLNVSAPPGSLSGPNVTLRDAASNETLAYGSARLLGISFRIPPGQDLYEVVISSSGAAGQEAFSLCVGTESGSAPCPATVTAFVAPIATALPSQPTPTNFVPVSIPANGPCQVASASGAVINVRAAPTTTSDVIGRLNPTATALVLGRLPDGTWYQVSLNGVTGWIATSVVVAGGTCGTLPVVAPTSPATPTTNLTTTATPTPTTNLTATATFTPTITLSPTYTYTPTPTLTPAAVATLNFSLPPNYGSTALTSGFVPDPYTIGITAGGPVNVSYLGGGCTGFATSAPDFSVNYTSGAFPTLRMYFIGSGDTTMVINAPNGSYYCVDDSFGTLNPTIDFNTPSSGRYDIWIGSYASGTFVSGTLYVTENTGNHP
ncbi:MAG: SH3 domain-containing protein [Anaerolineae bacterium]|nr:SH3 domain-containing protein [Anaerolineae bacterium]